MFFFIRVACIRKDSGGSWDWSCRCGSHAGAGFMPAGVAAGLIAVMRQVHVYYRLAKIKYGIVLNFVFTIIIER